MHAACVFTHELIESYGHTQTRWKGSPSRHGSVSVQGLFASVGFSAHMTSQVAAKVPLFHANLCGIAQDITASLPWMPALTDQPNGAPATTSRPNWLGEMPMM